MAVKNGKARCQLAVRDKKQVKPATDLRKDQPEPDPAIVEESNQSRKMQKIGSKTDEEYSFLHNLSVQDVRDVRGLFMSIDTDGGVC